jgi:hypothetical protein
MQRRCEIAAVSLRNRYAMNAKSLSNRYEKMRICYAIVSQSQRNRYTITAVSLRNLYAKALRNRFTINA